MPNRSDKGSEKPGKDPWCQLAGQMLKDLMYLKRVNYKELSKRLAALGMDENPKQLTNKVNRGQFSLVFFVQCLQALEVDGFEVNWEALQGEQASPSLSVKNVKNAINRQSEPS
jgi:hypothetical protein